MKKDFDMNIWKLDESLESLNIYPLGDVHIGSDMFNEELLSNWTKKVLLDTNSKVVLVGDMIDNGLKNSKTNCFEARYSPMEQKEILYYYLKPIKDKILGVVRGNHEYRSVDMADDCPLYDVMCRLQIEDLYRQNANFIKLSLGKRTKDRQFAYTMALMHGKSKNKTKNFSYAIDGLDILVTGHLHDADNHFPSKVVFDAHNEVMRTAKFTHVTVPSFQDFGGYALRDMYLPTSNDITPIIELSGKDEKGVKLHWV